MVLTTDQQRVRALIKDTLTMLCRNGLNYRSEICIEALIGITLDKDNVLLVNINETFHGGVEFKVHTSDAPSPAVSDSPDSCHGTKEQSSPKPHTESYDSNLSSSVQSCHRSPAESSSSVGSKHGTDSSRERNSPTGIDKQCRKRSRRNSSETYSQPSSRNSAAVKLEESLADGNICVKYDTGSFDTGSFGRMKSPIDVDQPLKKSRRKSPEPDSQPYATNTAAVNMRECLPDVTKSYTSIPDNTDSSLKDHPSRDTQHYPRYDEGDDDVVLIDMLKEEYMSVTELQDIKYGIDQAKVGDQGTSQNNPNQPMPGSMEQVRLGNVSTAGPIVDPSFKSKEYEKERVYSGSGPMIRFINGGYHCCMCGFSNRYHSTALRHVLCEHAGNEADLPLSTVEQHVRRGSFA